MECTDRPPSLKDVSIFALQRSYGRFLRNVINNTFENELKVQMEMQKFCSQMLNTIPSRLADEIFSALKEVWMMTCWIHDVQVDDRKLLFEAQKELSKYELKEKHILCVLSIAITYLLHIKIMTFSLRDYDYVFAHQILQTLTSMPNLQNLDLGHILCNDYENLVVKGLKCLPNLKSLNCSACTDNILYVISRNCLHIESISLRISKLSSYSICGLSNCKKLSYIDLRCCFYLPQAVAYLLMSLSSLEEVYIWKMDQVLNAIETIPKRDLRLKVFSDAISSVHLKKVNKLWPQVHTLSVYCDRENFIIESEFSCLQHLVVHSLDFSDSGDVLQFFQNTPKLSHLELYEPQNVTPQSFYIVAECLANLETFILVRPNISQFGIHLNREVKIEFPSLTFLEVTVGCDLHEIFFTFQCPKLKRFIVNCSKGIGGDTTFKFRDMEENNSSTKLNEVYHPDNDLILQLDYTISDE